MLASQGSPQGVGAGANYFPPGRRVAAPIVAGRLLVGGQPYSTATDRGHVLVVNFWGSWCDPCRAEAGDLEAVARATAAQAVRFVGVDIEERGRPRALAFIRAHRITYPSIYDDDGSTKFLFHRYPPVSTPTTYVIDPSNRIAAVVYGRTTTAELTSLIEHAM